MAVGPPLLNGRLVDRSETIDHSLHAIQSHLQRLHGRAVAQTDEMMARAVEQISPLARVQVKEDARHDNNFFLETCLEKVQSVRDGLGKTFQIKPDVKGAVGNRLEVEAHGQKTMNHIVALVLKQTLAMHRSR